MTPCVAAYVSRGWFLPVQLLRDVSPASREPLRAAAYGFHAGDTSVLPWSCRAIYPPAHLLQTSTSRRQQPASQATTNRVSRQTDGNPAAAPPDEAAPTEPRRSASRPALPRRRVGQLRVAGDGAAAAPKGVPPCSSQVLPPAEPGSGRVAQFYQPRGLHMARGRTRTQPASDAQRCGPPSKSGLHTLLRAGQPKAGRQRGEKTRTCRRGSQGAQGEQGARGVTDGCRACGRAGSFCSAPPRRRVPAAAVPSSPFVLIAASAAGRSSPAAPEATRGRRRVTRGPAAQEGGYARGL